MSDIDLSCFDDQGPQDCNVVLDLTDLNDLCLLMPRRLLVTGILVQWLRKHFSDPTNLDSTFLQDVIWFDNLETTKIIIDSVFAYKPSESERRPGIFVKPGAWKIVRYGIDDRKMIPRAATKAVCCDNTHVYNVMYQGSHTVFCIAGESAEVEILSNEVLKEIIGFGPIIRKKFDFLRFVVTDMGEPAIVEEATENFVVPIQVSYGHQDVWKICMPDEMDDNWIGQDLLDC